MASVRKYPWMFRKVNLQAVAHDRCHTITLQGGATCEVWKARTSGHPWPSPGGLWKVNIARMVPEQSHAFSWSVNQSLSHMDILSWVPCLEIPISLCHLVFDWLCLSSAIPARFPQYSNGRVAFSQFPELFRCVEVFYCEDRQMVIKAQSSPISRVTLKKNLILWPGTESHSWRMTAFGCLSYEICWCHCKVNKHRLRQNEMCGGLIRAEGAIYSRRECGTVIFSVTYYLHGVVCLFQLEAE